MLNLTTVTDQHSSQGTELSRHNYQTTSTNRCELKDCRCELKDRKPINIPRQVPNSADTPTKPNTPTDVNLTTVTDQHSSQGTQLSRHSYQTKCSNQCERNDCS